MNLGSSVPLSLLVIRIPLPLSSVIVSAAVVSEGLAGVRSFWMPGKEMLILGSSAPFSLRVKRIPLPLVLLVEPEAGLSDGFAGFRSF